jgi:hypothetical protein
MYYFIVPWNHIKSKNVLEAGEQLQLYIIIIIIIIIKGLLRNTFWHPKVNCNMLTET